MVHSGRWEWPSRDHEINSDWLSQIRVEVARRHMTLSGETMKTGASRLFRRSFVLAAVGILALVLTACTGRGGGQLPPSAGFTGAASFGFSFSCEDKGGINPPTGQLRIELSYTDKGSNPFGSPFGIHGIVDTIDPVLESMIC